MEVHQLGRGDVDSDQSDVPKVALVGGWVVDTRVLVALGRCVVMACATQAAAAAAAAADLRRKESSLEEGWSVRTLCMKARSGASYSRCISREWTWTEKSHQPNEYCFVQMMMMMIMMDLWVVLARKPG